MVWKEDSINLRFSNYKQEGLYLHFDTIRASQTSELKGDRGKRGGSQEKGRAASTV
jgi:hypothetical protein